MAAMEYRSSVLEEETGLRIDKYLALKLGEDYSRSFARKMIEDGLTLVNGQRVKPSYTLSSGEEIRYTIPETCEELIEPEDIPLNIIFEDDHIIVIDKPAGLVVHPGAGNKRGTLVNGLLFHCKRLPDTGDVIRPGIVHRLDKDTSGIIVAAKTEKAHRFLSRQFQKRKVHKRYIALVRGKVESDNGVVDAGISRDPKDRKKMVVDIDDGKPSRTVFHVAKRFERFTALKLEPETGRTHQIRVHMKYIGHPVLGDIVYGWGNEMTRHALHAEKLIFKHPEKKELMEFHSPVPDDIISVIKRGDF